MFKKTDSGTKNGHRNFTICLKKFLRSPRDCKDQIDYDDNSCGSNWALSDRKLRAARKR